MSSTEPPPPAGAGTPGTRAGHDAIHRLRAAHPEHAEHITRWAGQARRRLEHARVPTFVPVLLERDVRRRLAAHLVLETHAWGPRATTEFAAEVTHGPATDHGTTTTGTTSKENTVLKGFKDFLLRGNIVELAVAVVIGAAFTAVVTAFTSSFLKPLIQLVSGGGEAAGTVVVDGVVFDYASFLNQVVTFVITAAVVYFLVVLPIKTIEARRPAGPTAPTEAELLVQIRDLMAADAERPARRREPVDPAPADTVPGARNGADLAHR